jgi:hypothetical protein
MRVSPTAPESAAPTSNVGTARSTLIGSRVPRARGLASGLEEGPRAFADARLLTAGFSGSGKLDIPFYDLEIIDVMRRATAARYKRHE